MSNKAFQLGMNAKLYKSSTLLDGDTDTPDTVTWSEIDNCKDLTLNMEKGESDVTTRANDGWRATAGTLKEASVEFEMQWQPGDTGFSSIRDAFLNDTEIAMLVFDGDVNENENQGLAANFVILNFSRNEPLEEAMTVNVTARPSSHIEWYVTNNE